MLFGKSEVLMLNFWEFAVKEGSSKYPDLEKGEVRTSTNASSNNEDIQRVSSKGSVLSAAGKVSLCISYFEQILTHVR